MITYQIKNRQGNCKSSEAQQMLEPCNGRYGRLLCDFIHRSLSRLSTFVPAILQVRQSPITVV